MREGMDTTEYEGRNGYNRIWGKEWIQQNMREGMDITEYVPKKYKSNSDSFWDLKLKSLNFYHLETRAGKKVSKYLMPKVELNTFIHT